MAKSNVSLPIEFLECQLRERFPEASVQLDRPRKRSGVWYLDIRRNGHPIIIQWQQGKGFGVSSPAAPGYGEGADEEYPDEEATYGRAVSLLLSGTFTAPPEPVRLSELRKERGISQAELAELLNKQQGEVSKIERRNDVKLSTLRDYVKSIGGSLQVLARLPNGVVRVIEIEDEQNRASRKGSLAARQ
ncbi:MAG: helix-turn-helix transcriptional regulator [Pirellulaceae bacterium]